MDKLKQLDNLSAADQTQFLMAMVIATIIFMMILYYLGRFLVWMLENIKSHYKDRTDRPCHSSFKDLPNHGSKY